MGYQAQLVIRARDPERARTVERVKELADEQGKSIVEMAFELLERGMASMGTTPATTPASVKPEPKAATTKVEAKPAPAVVEDEPEAEAPVSHARSPETAVRPKPVPLSDLVDDIPEKAEYNGEPPEALAARCAEIFATDGAEKAAMTLTGFFAGAEPGEAAIFREALQGKINMADYLAIIEVLKETDEYRQYRRRVVYS